MSMNNKDKLLRKRNDLLQSRADQLDAATKAIENGDQATYKTIMDKVNDFNGQLETLDGLIKECEKEFPGVDPVQNPGDGFARTAKSGTALINSIRSREQYADAWIKALQLGVDVQHGTHVEGLQPLYDAEKAVKTLTISGGDPVGTDGGFLVPIDFDNQVTLLLKEFVDLATLVSVENVNVNSGWRAVETTASRTKLSLIAEGTNIPYGQQPSFSRVDYQCKKYGDRIPISNELLADSSALISYMAKWWTPKFILTRNALILAALNKLKHMPLTGVTDSEQLKSLKTLLNVNLNTAHSKRATILANSISYNIIDNWVDANGRPMLVPDPKNPEFQRFKNRLVSYADPDEIPNVSVGDASYAPLYVGNLKNFGTLFNRNGVRVLTTNIGGNAWATDTTELRATCRMDFQVFDEDAVIYSGIAIDGDTAAASADGGLTPDTEDPV